MNPEIGVETNQLPEFGSNPTPDPSKRSQNLKQATEAALKRLSPAEIRVFLVSLAYYNPKKGSNLLFEVRIRS